MKYFVGKNGGTGQVFQFSTLREAEEKIAEIEKFDPVGVHNGEYYIDIPEDEIGR
jgi:hypothetical protein